MKPEYLNGDKGFLFSLRQCCIKEWDYANLAVIQS